jgi:Bacteriocin-protection, YdeI or OmpD-Associated/Domain of unknown function (DUF1905)
MILEKFTNSTYFVSVPTNVVTTFLEKGTRRAICIINGQVEWHCAFMPKKEGGYFVTIGSKICKQLNLKLGDDISLNFKEDTTDYQFDMPEEFSEVLYQDADAFSIFEDLTDGNKRGLIYLVTAVKSSDKRIKRALKIVEKLKLGITSPRKVL